MTSERDIERLLDRWFTERPTQVADRVIDDVAARIVRQPQRPAWRLRPWRFPTMSTPIKLVAVGAALLIVALGGAVLMGGGSGPVLPAPTATPSPSPVASAAPSAGAVFPEWWPQDGPRDGAGILPAGSGSTESFRPGFTFSAPEGWVNDIDSADFYGLFPDTPANQAEFARSGELAHHIFMGNVDTPGIGICEGVGETEGSTAAELVDSLVADEALVTSEPVDVTIGGLTGARVDAHLDPDWTASCSDNPEDSPTEDDRDYRGRFIFLDRPGGGRILIIVDSIDSAAFEGFLAEAMPIVESFDFDLSN